MELIDSAVHLARAGDHDAAWSEVERRLAISSKDLTAWLVRGHLHARRGEPSSAHDAFSRAATLAPERPALASLAASMGATNPSIPHRREVASLFDDYAPLFDHHLVETLGYVGHEMLADAACNVRKRYSCAVDLGCGTGLAAPALRGACERLVGVDLSVEMILEASQRGGYDELWVADLWYTLTTLETGESDLLFAADVFGYVGPLDGVFDEAQRILPTGGRLAFTVEAHLGPEPFVVQASRRVAYRADYIAGLARQAGFIAETFGEATLRREAGDGVPALLSVWLRQE